MLRPIGDGDDDNEMVSIVLTLGRDQTLVLPKGLLIFIDGRFIEVARP